MYEALHAYRPRTHGEIALHVGDKITGAKDVGNGWIVGFNQRSGETGILPLTYLQLLEPQGLRRTVRRGFNSVFHRSRRGAASAKEVRGEADGEKEAEEMDDLYENCPVPKGKKVDFDETPSQQDDIPKKEEETNEVPLGRLGLLGQSVFGSARGEHRVLKGFLGFAFGLLLGGLITVLLFYSYHYSWKVAGIVGGILTFLLCLGLALSVHFRCMVTLTLPGIFSARGRAMLLSVIVAMMLTGPVTNITLNSQEAATSMACVAELAYNQSLALRGQLQEPVLQLRRSLEASRERLQDNFESIQQSLASVTNAIATVKNGVTSVSGFLQNAARQCSGTFNRARDKCNEAFFSTKRKCQQALDSVDVTDDVANFFSSSFWSRRRKRDLSHVEQSVAEAIPKLKRTKRMLRDVCKVFDVGRVCDGLEAGVFCKPVDVGRQIVSGLDNVTSRVTEALRELTEYTIEGQGGVEGDAEASNTPQQIVSLVRAEIQGSLDTASFVIDVVSKVLSVMVLLMFLQSALYLRNYLAKVTYDNIYISRKFRALDQAWSKLGQPAVLPLRKREAAKYVRSFSVVMSPEERSKSMLGLLTVVLLALQFAMTVLFDYVLYYVLYLTRKHGSFQFTVTGRSNVMFSVAGSGLMARLAQVFLQGLNVEASYSNVLNITSCLPVPAQPDLQVVYINVALFAVAVVCVLLQAYGLRLRHWIVAYYYPEQDEARIAYLHREILLKRKSASREAKERLTSGDQGQGRDKAKVGPLDKLASRLSCCRNLCPCFKHKVYRCQNCEEDSSTVRRCRGKGCCVLLCDDCMDSSDLCPVCRSEQ